MKPTIPHNLTQNIHLKEYIHTSLGSVFFYDNIVITEMNEGVSVSFETGLPILKKGLKIVGIKPFVIISNRVNSYAVNPNDYSYLRRIPNLKGIAIVAHRKEAKENAKLEAIFLKKPFEIFDSIDEALTWSRSLIG